MSQVSKDEMLLMVEKLMNENGWYYDLRKKGLNNLPYIITTKTSEQQEEDSNINLVKRMIDNGFEDEDFMEEIECKTKEDVYNYFLNNPNKFLENYNEMVDDDLYFEHFHDLLESYMSQCDECSGDPMDYFEGYLVYKKVIEELKKELNPVNKVGE